MRIGLRTAGIKLLRHRRELPDHIFLKARVTGIPGIIPGIRPRRFLLMLKSIFCQIFTANRRLLCPQPSFYPTPSSDCASMSANMCLSQGRKQARSCHQQQLTGNLKRCVRAAHERHEYHQTHGWASVLCIRVRSISTLTIEVDHPVRLLRTISAKVAARREYWCGGTENRLDMCPRVQIGCCT